MDPRSSRPLPPPSGMSGGAITLMPPSGSSLPGQHYADALPAGLESEQLIYTNQSSFVLECAKSLLKSPAASSVIRALIGESTARISAATVAANNWSHLIDLRTLDGYYLLVTGDEQSGTPAAPPEDASSMSAGGGHVINYLDLQQLADRLPASEGSVSLEALSERWQILLAVIYSLTAVSSFLLNMITVIVLLRCQRTELRKYLINLSLSDLLMSCFSIPFTYTEYMLGRWIFFLPLCPIVRSVVTLSVFVSIATMTVIGMNRHLAIMYPLKRRRHSKFKHWTMCRKTHVIVGIWLLGIAIALPEYLMFSAQPFCFNRQLYYDCRHSVSESISDSYTIFLYLSTFVVPLVLLSYLYTTIGLKLWRRQMPGNVDVNRDLTMQSKRTKVFKMLLVTVVLFAVFWLPLQTFSLVMFLYPQIRHNIDYDSLRYFIFIGTYFFCHWLGMAHSCINPLVYCFMNEKFRTDLRNLLCGLARKPSSGGARPAANGLAGCGAIRSIFDTSSAASRTHTRFGCAATSSLTSASLRGRPNTSGARRVSATNSLRSVHASDRDQRLSRDFVMKEEEEEEGEQEDEEDQAQNQRGEQPRAAAQLGPDQAQQLEAEVAAHRPAGSSDKIEEGAHSSSVGSEQESRAGGAERAVFSVRVKLSDSSPFDRSSPVLAVKSELGADETALHGIDEENEEEEEEDGEDAPMASERELESGQAAARTLRHGPHEYVIVERQGAQARPISAAADSPQGPLATESSRLNFE